jgi:hypothetical protein
MNRSMFRRGTIFLALLCLFCSPLRAGAQV